MILLVSMGFLFSAWRATSRAYAAYESEQREKEKRTREAVPAFVKASRQAVEHKEIDDALAQLSVALDHDRDNTEALLLKGQLLVSRKQFPAAAKVLDRYVQLKPEDANSAKLAKLCAAPDTEAASVQENMGNILVAQKQPALAITFFQASEKQLALYRKQLDAGGWPGSSLRLDRDRGLTYYHNGVNRLDKFLDLSPFRGIPLTHLRLVSARVPNLEPLRGMPLVSLSLEGLPFVNDLSPLRNMPLRELIIYQCPLIEDIKPLQGLHLESLAISKCPRVKDLSALKGMPLTKLNVTGHGLERSMLEDLSPLRDLPLQHLSLESTKIKDLGPLRGLKLQTLNLNLTYITDIRPLEDMPLTTLNLGYTSVVDISPLRGMRLTKLNLGVSGVKDVGPLQGMPRVELNMADGVSDLTPLKGMNLEIVGFGFPAKRITGLEILREMPTLRQIAYGPAGTFEAADFWRKFDNGEIK